MIYDFTILTEARYDRPEKPDGYTQNILTEDRILKEALEAKGATVNRVDWRNPNVDWNTARCAIFRTTWDYFYHYEEFRGWLERTSSHIHFVNPARLVQWNMDKHYLADLKERGINIPETRIIKKGETQSLDQIVKNTGWNTSILKPTVAGTARHTYKIDSESLDEVRPIFEKLVPYEDFLLQPFLPSIVEKGEVSIVMIGGSYSHAVLKKVKPGDFRVQDDFGGTLHEYTPTPDEIAFAVKAISVCDPHPYYARVDMVYDLEGKPAIGELELIEPELWFRRHPEAAARLAGLLVDAYTMAR
ncbi:MAG: hypothetical protein AAFW89_03445 [Bacteroidota bacterium]